MNEIGRTENFNNMSQAPLRNLSTEEKPQETQAPKDQVEIGKPEKSLLQKITYYPKKALGAVAGAVIGVANAPLHTIPGAVKGIAEGNASSKGRGTTGLFNFTLWTQNLAIGASAGLMAAGPVGAAIGAGVAALFTGVTSFIGYHSEAYDKMVERVETDVDKAVENNDGSKMKVFVQNATEGAIIGGSTATKSGMHIGYEAGKGVVDGVFGAAEGILEGIYDAGKSIINDIKN